MSATRITIELDDGFLGGWEVLINALERAREETGLAVTFGSLLRQVRRQTAQKPDEPTGLGAVVTTEDDGDYVRISFESRRPWQNVQTGAVWDWEAVAATRVLSEGVQS